MPFFIRTCAFRREELVKVCSMHEGIAPEIKIDVGSGHEAARHFKIGAVLALCSSQLLRIVRNSTLGIDAALIAKLNNRVQAVCAEILASAVMSKSFWA